MSSLMDWIISNAIVLSTSIDYSAILIDGSFIAQSHKPKGAKNIAEYIESIFISLICKHFLEYQRVYLLLDSYFVKSIKNVIRIVEVMADDTVLSRSPRNWKKNH